MVLSAKTRFPLMALAAISLLAALWAGLVCLGWQLPPLPFLPAGHHGAFMVSGFLGTVISLERAVALRQNRLAGAGAGILPALLMAGSGKILRAGYNSPCARLKILVMRRWSDAMGEPAVPASGVYG